MLAQRAMWSRQGLRNYSYDYTEIGFFICCTEGQQMKLEVRNDTVVSAVFAATGQPVPGSAARLPTIDGLFDLAEQAARDHRLGGILFDPLLHYPLVALSSLPMFSAYLDDSPRSPTLGGGGFMSKALLELLIAA
ncbi:MAG: hypothetical protein DMD41_13555 [Gemmatimonadetes bacterium]|nr:MAG: hypothetical protein DMD41_13555 [Gemmatimonadota bacterium]